MEPLKKVQVEGYMMFAEPEVLFGNLDELCCVSCFLKINPDLSDNFSCAGYLRFLQGVCKPPHQACNTWGRFTCFGNSIKYLWTKFKSSSGFKSVSPICPQLYQCSELPGNTETTSWVLRVWKSTLLQYNLCFTNSLFQWCNKDPRCKKLQLTDLLVAPVHHIMKVGE